MDTTTQIVTILIMVFVLALSAIATQFVLRRRDLIVLRPLAAYQTLPMLIGAAVESNRPVHVSSGSSGLDGGQTLVALASTELAYQIAQRAAIGDQAPLLTFSNATLLPLMQDTLRRAYGARGLIRRMPKESVRWYPSGGRALAFAAALTGLAADDKPLLHVLSGDFGAELALVAEATIRHDQPLIAASSRLEGQAVAYVMGNMPLIGEEIFVANAYLGDDAIGLAGVAVQDILRYVVIIAITIPVIVALIEPVSQAFQQLLGGR